MTEPTPKTKKSLFALFANLPVKAKIMTGFALVLAILAIVGVTGVLSFRSVGTNFAAYERSVDVAGTALSIGRGTLNMRRNAREFALTGDEADAEKMHEYQAKVIELIERELTLTQDPEVLAKVREIEDLVKRYGESFERVVELKHEDTTQTAELAGIGGEVTDGLKGLVKDAGQAGNSNAMIVAQAALQGFMELRINVIKATGGGEDAPAAAERVVEGLESVEAAIEGLAKASQGSPLAEKVETLAQGVKTYNETYTKLTEINSELLGLIDGTMAEFGAGITAGIDWLDDNGATTQSTLKDQVDATVASARTTMLVLALGGIVLGLALAWLIGNGIGGPLVRAVGSLSRLAQGDLAAEIFGVGRKDEVGKVADGLQVFKDNMIRAKQVEEEAKAAEVKAAQERRQAMLELADKFDASVGGIVGIVSSSATEMQSNAQSLSATAEQTNQQASAVAAASEEATTNVQTVASASEELAASISEIGRQVAQSASIASMAVDEAKRTDAMVQGLSEAAQKIGDVVNLISDIASQTNLLALNATIEAARAGEAGKGFAVVASEVKSLANQTAKATEEIAAQIGGIQGSTRDAVGAIQSIGKTIGEINNIASTISAAVEEQGAATREIARNVQQASQGTTEVSKNIGGVTQAAGETGSAAAQVLSAADELSNQAEKLKSEVDAFLRTVRAA